MGQHRLQVVRHQHLLRLSHHGLGKAKDAVGMPRASAPIMNLGVNVIITRSGRLFLSVCMCMCAWACVHVHVCMGMCEGMDACEGGECETVCKAECDGSVSVDLVSSVRGV